LSFYTMADGEKATVSVGHSLVSFYLTTAGDGTTANNLDTIAANTGLPANPVFWV